MWAHHVCFVWHLGAHPWGFKALSFGLSHVGGLEGPPHMLALKPLVGGPLLGWGPYQWLDGLHNQVHGPPHGLVARAIGLAIVVGLGGLATSGSNKLHVGTKCLAWQLGLVGPNYKLWMVACVVWVLVWAGV